LIPVPIAKDTLPPIISKITFESQTCAVLEFNEAIKIQNPVFRLKGDTISRWVEKINSHSIRFYSVKPWPCNDTFQLEVSGFLDTQNNPIGSAGLNLFYPCLRDIQLGELVVTEIMHNPSSFNLWLPPIKYVEIFNQSSCGLWLTNSKICDAVSCATLPNYWLLPNKPIVLFNASDSLVAGKNLKSVGIPVAKLPSFNTTEDSIILLNSSGSAIYRNRYKQEFHQKPFDAGGYSLERSYLDSNHGHWLNWQSNRSSGGSPGHVDTCPKIPRPPICKWSLALVNKTTEQLTLTSLHTIPIETLKTVVFQILTTNNETIPFVPKIIENSSNLSRWLIPTQILSLITIPCKLIVRANFSHHRIATIDTLEIIDESKAINPNKSDLIVSEIQFNGSTSDLDFIEIYNPGEFPVDLSSMAIRYYHNDSIPTWQLTCSQPHYILPPKKCIVLCNDAEKLKLSHPDFPMVSAMENPLFSGLYADFGLIELFNMRSFESIHLAGYNSNWHNPNLEKTEGISLERVGQGQDAVNPWNWHSHSDFFLTNKIPIRCNHIESTNEKQAIQNCSPGIFKEWKKTDNHHQFRLNRPYINPNGSFNYLCLEYQLPMPDCLVQLKILSSTGGLLSIPVPKDILSFTGCLCFPPVTTNNLPKGAYLLSVKCLFPNGESVNKLLPFRIL